MTEVVKQKTLEERVREKLHAQIGDLITQEDLQQIVERGVEEALFKPREERDRYGHTTTKKPSLAAELVAETLEKQMRAAVNAWIAENRDQFAEMVQEAVGKNGRDLALAALGAALQPAFNQVIYNLQTNGQLPHG